MKPNVRQMSRVYEPGNTIEMDDLNPVVRQIVRMLIKNQDKIDGMERGCIEVHVAGQGPVTVKFRPVEIWQE